MHSQVNSIDGGDGDERDTIKRHKCSIALCGAKEEDADTIEACYDS